MDTPSGNANRIGASSRNSQRPERLSRGPSPYATSLVSGIATSTRRVQSALPSRQRSSLGPNVKASELFRKNSEPQIPNKRNINNIIKQTESDAIKISKTKHVRIDTDTNTNVRVPPPKSRTFSSAHLAKDRGGPSSFQSSQKRRPFSFSTDRSRSASIASNDSNQCVDENDMISLHEEEFGSGDAPTQQWGGDCENNNSANNNITNVRQHPRLSKRSYSVDTTSFEPEQSDDLYQQDFLTQMIQMRIAEQPEETLKEANTRIASNVKRDSGNFNKVFSKKKDDSIESAQGENVLLKATEFDRMLLLKSDSILQEVSDLITEIKSTESDSPDQMKLKSVDNVDESNEFNTKPVQEQNDSSFRNQTNSIQEKLDSIEGRFSTLELSGIELSDIMCPQNVMEQSVPNSSRLERPFSAVVLGKTDIEKISTSFSSGEGDNNSKNDSVESNNIFFSTTDALATIQQVSAGASPSHSNSGYNINQDDIQRKICSALRLLEEEEQKRHGGMRHSSSRSGARSQSPLISVSLPDSRPDSQVQSCKSSPRLRSEDRNAMYYNQPTSKGAFDAGGFSSHSHDQEAVRNVHALNSGSRSARSCSCIADHRSSESLNSARSAKTTVGHICSTTSNLPSRLPRPDSGGDEMWNTTGNKTKQIFSFLDEVEKSDQEILFGLRFDSDGKGRPRPGNSAAGISKDFKSSGPITTSRNADSEDKQFRTMDCLIRKGSVELSREILLLERKLDEAHHAVKLLEESLLNQRELNIRNLRNSERDFKKRIRMQKEEFDVAFSRNEALINEMVAEKRVLQEKLDKLIKNFEEMDEKHKEQIKAMQQKHLDEIRRLRKMQQNAESSLKQKLAGNKAQAHEIREMTVKGLEPEVQRIIQRHQQEMSEMRAWHTDEVRETEERYQRKLHMQLEDTREKFAKEKEDIISRERELANRRLDAELKQKDDEIENLKRRLTNEIFEERERAVSEEVRLKEIMQEAVRKAQIKGEVELENLKQEYATKLANLERKHECELKSLTDVHEAEKQNWTSNQTRKLEHSLADQEAKLREIFQDEKDKEWREKEKKLKEEFEKFRKDDENATEARFRRMQEKLQFELEEMEKSERDLKTKFSQTKSDLIAREEEIFSMKTSLAMKDKQITDLQEINMKMQEERVNLTSVIRREFTDQIQVVEEECRSLKSSIVEIQSNSKLQLEQKQLEIEKVIVEKDAEIEKIGLRVKQALARKDETISELQKQFENSSYQISHLEELLEEQRKEFLHGMKLQSSSAPGARKK
ncbi:unnamed protein product [Orchesella dallaii]|uniref:5-azacytidine-induced protein 1 n=1 Tax=Orchesella dallaii TaxID=48710 RepID=A0ABP1QXT7_9HEXA